MVPVYNMGHESGLWDTTLRTDTELLTKKELTNNAKNLKLFRPDGKGRVFYSTLGHTEEAWDDPDIR